MKTRPALTLIELTVVIFAVAVLIGITSVAVKTLQSTTVNNFSIPGIENILATARGYAETEHTYAGVRFQKSGQIQYAIIVAADRQRPYKPDDPNIPLMAVDNRPPYKLGRTSYINIKQATILFSPQGRFIRKRAQLFAGPGDIFGDDPVGKISDKLIVIKTDAGKKFYGVSPYVGTLIAVKNPNGPAGP